MNTLWEDLKKEIDKTDEESFRVPMRFKQIMAELVYHCCSMVPWKFERRKVALRELMEVVKTMGLEPEYFISKRSINPN